MKAYVKIIYDKLSGKIIKNINGNRSKNEK